MNPSGENFTPAVYKIFKTNGDKLFIQEWNCCLKEHGNTSGQHYHICPESSGPKKQNICHIGITEFLVTKIIRTEDEVFGRAHDQSAEGTKNLKKNVLSYSPKALQDLF